MNVNAQFLVLFANPYKVVDDKTGQISEGVSCTYILNNNIFPKKNDDGSLGFQAVKCSFPKEEFTKFSSVPGVYEFECEFGAIGGAGGKAALKPISVLNFISCTMPPISDKK